MSYHRFGGERSRKILMYALAQQQAAAKAAPEDITAPTITPEEEAAILEAMLPIPEPEPSFLRRNAIPLFLGGGALIVGAIGMLLMVEI